MKPALGLIEMLGFVGVTEAADAATKAATVELAAVEKIEGEVVVTSDSKYVVDAVTKGWVFNWEKRGFKKKKNPDLWKRFLVVYPKNKIIFKINTKLIY